MPPCVTTPTTLAWRGITIGMAGDPSLTADSNIDGLDLPDVDVADLPIAMGAQPGRIRWPARDVTATRVITLTPGTADDLRAAMISGDADQAPEPLDITAPTMWVGTRRLWAVARRCQSSIARPQMLTRGLLRDLQWTGHDPRLYGTDEVEFALPGTPAHVGNVAAPWRAELHGPIAAPRITRTDTGDAMIWPTVTLTGAQVLTVDVRAETATINGVVDVWGLSVDDDGRPPIGWEVAPGDGVPMTTNAPTGAVFIAPAWL